VEIAIVNETRAIAVYCEITQASETRARAALIFSELRQWRESLGRLLEWNSLQPDPRS
jgi:hypothetical protein